MPTPRLPVSFLFLSALVFTAKHSPEALANGVFGGNPGIRVETTAGDGYSVSTATALLDRVTWKACNGTYFTQRYNQNLNLADTVLQAPAGDWCEVQIVFGSLLVMSGQSTTGSYSVTTTTKALTLPYTAAGFDYESLGVVQYNGVFGGNPGMTASLDLEE